MLVFSLVFYACGEPKYVLLLIGMALADWLLALAVEKAGSTLWRRTALIGACAVSLGLLGVFKYGTFVLGNVNALTGFPPSSRKSPCPSASPSTPSSCCPL